MRLIVHDEKRKVRDGSHPTQPGIITKGVHEVEIIDPPVWASDRDKRLFQEGNPDFRWIVLKGTLIGASIHFWKMWSNHRLGVHWVEIIYDENPKKLP